MVDHIKNGNEGVLISVAEGSVVDEEVTPFIAAFELFKTDLFFGEKEEDILFRDGFVQKLAEVFHMVVFCYVVDKKIIIL